jgi:hypothetical protein
MDRRKMAHPIRQGNIGLLKTVIRCTLPIIKQLKWLTIFLQILN